MKRKISILMILLLLFSLLPAWAAAEDLADYGKNVVIEEVKDGVNVYVFARLENMGRYTVTFKSGRFDVYDTAGNLLCSDENPAVYAAKYLNSHESGYLKAHVDLEGVRAEEIGACELTYESDVYHGKSRIDRFACTPAYEEDVPYSRWLSYDYMGVTVTNETDTVLYDLEAVTALYGSDGRILNIGYAFMGMLNDIGLHPGATVTMRDINSDSMQAAYTKAGDGIAYMEGIAYVEVYG